MDENGALARFTSDAFLLLFQRRSKDFRKNLRRVLRGGAADDVHDLRVAARRLRELGALAGRFTPGLLTGPLNQRLDEAVEEVSRLRNQDILLETLRRETARRPQAARRAAAGLFRLARARREKLYGEARAALRGMREGSLAALEGVEAWIRAHLGRVPDEELWRAAKSELAERKERFERARAAAAPGKPETFHGLRQAARRLRYQAEIARDVFNAPLEGACRRLEAWQEALGGLQDSRVYGKRLRKLKDRFLEKNPSSPNTFHLLRSLAGAEGRAVRAALRRLRGPLKRPGLAGLEAVLA